MSIKKIIPAQGKVYRNRCGSEFRCIQVHNGIPTMRNIQSGWTVEAHHIWQYEDGTIIWDYSTGGRFEN